MISERATRRPGARRWLRRRGPKTLALRWDSIPYDEVQDHPGAVDEVIVRGRDGITVTGVFDPDEIERALTHLAPVDKIERRFGHLLGMPIGMVGPDDGLDAFLDDNDRATEHLTSAFGGIHPHERVTSAIQPMTRLRIAQPAKDGRPYAPAQVRWWEPGGGGLPAHVGNEFRAVLADGAMKHLLTVTTVTDHLSYFVVLQRPELGGALSVYDLLWDEDQGVDGFDGAWREDSWIESYDQTKFDLEPGDMVVFGGGWRWHRVDPILGSRQRITYGGFAAPSLSDEELHFWA